MSESRDWNDCTIGEISKLSGGSAFKEEFQGNTTGEIPFIKVSDFNLSENEKYITRANNWVTAETIKEMGARVFPAGSVVFPKVGAALLSNRRRILSRPTALDNNLMAAIPNGCRSDYLHLALCQIDFSRFVQDGAVPSVNQEQVASVELSLPPLPEQKKIAEILSGIDRSIYALSQKISRERLLANAVTSELLAKIVSESEMGTIRDVATFITKGTTPTSVGLTFSPKGIAFVKAQSIGGSGEMVRSTFSFIDEIAHKQLSRSSLKENDVLITIAGTIGRSAVVPENILPANTNQAVAIVRLDPSRMHSSFLSAWIRSKRCQARFTGLQTIGAQPNVSLQQISETPVPLISIEGQSHFISAHESFYSSLTSLTLEKDRYSLMKKSLASDLLSGRKRVSI